MQTSDRVETPGIDHDAAADCPIGLAINSVGGRWKLHVLRTLLLCGPCRYNFLLGSINGISAKELTRNLGELQAGRLVELVRTANHDVYALTALGRQVEQPLRALGVFGTALARR